MAATKMVAKKINLGQGFVYYEVVKPSRATIHQLKQYIWHESDGGNMNGMQGTRKFVCWICRREAPKEVIEKGMTILSMRIL